MRRFIDIISQASSDNLTESLLMEAKAYEQMLEPLKKLIKTYQENLRKEIAHPDTSVGLIDDVSKLAEAEDFLTHIHGFAKTLRQDRAVWFTRDMRLLMVCVPFARWASTYSHFEHIEQTHAYAVASAAWWSLHSKYEQDYNKQTGAQGQYAGTMMPSMAKTTMQALIGNIEHYLGIPFHKFQEYVFSPQKSWEQIHLELQEIEEEYKEKYQMNLTLQEGDEIILKMPDNYVWVKLSRAYCPDEAKAMGHCGNSPASATQQRILSLRHVEFVENGIKYMRPCLTFILLPDGTLGEMKGRGNAKPAEHYHDQIEALLRLPMIKGITGGGYAAERNFAMTDLEPERRKKLGADKPVLMTLEDRFETWGLNDALIEDLHKAFEQQGRPFPEFWSMSQSGSLIFNRSTDEERDALRQKYPLMTMSPSDYYKKFGMTDDLMDLIGRGTRSFNKRRWLTEIAKFPLDDISTTDREKLFDKYPHVMTVLQYYQRNGLDDELMQEIVDGVTDAQSATGLWRVSDGQRWYNDYQNDTEGFTPYAMSDEDRMRLWTEHPEVMSLYERYKTFGLTDSFAKYIADGIREEGPEVFWQKHETFSVDEMKEGDREKLFEKEPSVAPFVWQAQHIGKIANFDNAAYAENVRKAMIEWNESASYDQTEWDEKANVFVVFKYDDVEELIDSVGDKDFKNYASEDDYDPDVDVRDDDHHVENFDDVISEQIVRKIGARVLAKMTEEDADEDEIEDFDPTSWKDIFEKLEEYDSDVYYSVLQAVSDGYRSGIASEVYDAKISALKDADLTTGALDFTTHTHNGKHYIDFSQPVRFIMTQEEIAKFLDGTDFKENTEANLEEFLQNGEISMNVPYYGWNDFDDSAAREYFIDNFDEEVEKNPYTDINEMGHNALINALSELHDKMPGLYRPEFNGLDDDALRKKLEYAVKKYYG